MRPTQSTSNNALTPQLTPNPQPREDASSTELLNLLRQRLSIARTHIVAQTIMAQKDEEGNFSWVEFEPGFHSHLVKCAFSLLNAPITHSAQKQLKRAIFTFILEILNQEYEDTFFAPKCGDAKENCASHEKKRPACKHRHDKKQKQKHSCDDNKLAELPPTPKMAPLADAEASDTPPTPTSSTLPTTTLQDHTTLLAAPAILTPSLATPLSRKPQTPPPPNPCPTPTIPTPPAPLIPTQTPPIPPAMVPPPLVPAPSTPAPPQPTQTPCPYPATDYQLFVLQMNDDVDNIMLQWKEKNPGQTMKCEGSQTEKCSKPATHIKMHGPRWFPKCDVHVDSREINISHFAIPEWHL